MKSPTEFEQRAALIAAWMVKFFKIFRTYGMKEDELPGISDQFLEALDDLPPAQLAGAFDAWRRTGEKFPVPADIRKLIEKHAQAIDTLAAEQAFERVRWMMRKFAWTIDSGLQPIVCSKDAKLSPEMQERADIEDFRGGWMLKPKPFDDRTDYAIRAMGGLGRISQSDGTKEWDFCKRAFMGAYQYFISSDGLKLPSRTEAKLLIESLEAGQ